MTGSSSGLGRATALRLARLGATILCCDISPQTRAARERPSHSQSIPASDTPTHELITKNGGTGHFHELDVSSLPAFQDAVRFAVNKVSPRKRLDIIVNNAGIPGLTTGNMNEGIHTEPADFAEKIIKVNLMGTWNGTKAVVTQMLEQEVELFPGDSDICSELGDVPLPDGQGGLVDPRTCRGSRGTIVNMGSIHGMVCGPCERTSLRSLTCEVEY